MKLDNHINCVFSDISEHDMDMLFLEEFACSKDFTSIFTDKIGINDFEVISLEASKTDIMLGESDMTVVLKVDEVKIGLLIEDKIDAVAMPEQASRYTLRGEKGISNGDYDSFYVFIVAPKKYLSQNKEASKYPYKVEYERIVEYFEQVGDQRSSFKVQQLRQAIEKQKKGYQVQVDPLVTDFWKRYYAYQKKNFPDLYLLYNGEEKGPNATWPQFNTVIKGLFMYHKTEFGFVDMTFNGCGNRIVEIEEVIKKVCADYLERGYCIVRTGKSAAVRLYVPVLDLHKTFDSQIEEISKCFTIIRQMSELAKQMPSLTIQNLIG